MILSLPIAIIQDDLLAIELCKEQRGQRPQRIGIIRCRKYMQDVTTPGAQHYLEHVERESRHRPHDLDLTQESDSWVNRLKGHAELRLLPQTRHQASCLYSL